jgi:hypothetical protein
MRFLTSVFLMLLLQTAPAAADVPDYILSVREPYNGIKQPQVAVFKHNNQKIGFVLGCQKLAERWTGAPQRKVVYEKWGDELKEANVVADIYCDGRTEKFQSRGEPGSFVVTYNRGDGKKHLHFVDNEAWFKAVKGDVTKISPDELRALVVERGPDFHSKVAAATSPHPAPSPPQGNNCSTPFPYNQCISVGQSAPTKARYTNSCDYSVTLHLENKCNGHTAAADTVIRVSSNGYIDLDTTPSYCDWRGGNTFTRSIVKACR